MFSETYSCTSKYMPFCRWSLFTSVSFWIKLFTFFLLSSSSFTSWINLSISKIIPWNVLSLPFLPPKLFRELCYLSTTIYCTLNNPCFLYFTTQALHRFLLHLYSKNRLFSTFFHRAHLFSYIYTPELTFFLTFLPLSSPYLFSYVFTYELTFFLTF